jgi:hypothetical protein
VLLITRFPSKKPITLAVFLCSQVAHKIFYFKHFNPFSDFQRSRMSNNIDQNSTLPTSVKADDAPPTLKRVTKKVAAKKTTTKKVAAKKTASKKVATKKTSAKLLDQSATITPELPFVAPETRAPIAAETPVVVVAEAQKTAPASTDEEYESQSPRRFGRVPGGGPVTARESAKDAGSSSPAEEPVNSTPFPKNSAPPDREQTIPSQARQHDQRPIQGIPSSAITHPLKTDRQHLPKKAATNVVATNASAKVVIAQINKANARENKLSTRRTLMKSVAPHRSAGLKSKSMDCWSLRRRVLDFSGFLATTSNQHAMMFL